VTLEGLPPAERSIDDVIAGLIRFSLGGRPFAMAVLPMAAHDRWLESLNSQTAAEFAKIPDSGPLHTKSLRDAVRAGRDRMVDALIEYDRDGVLPTRDEIFELATGQEIFAAIGEVVAVGGDPFGLVALTAAKRRLASLGATNGSTKPPARTKRSPRSTAGRSRRSGRR
jgi:hypothetical protein